MKNILVIGVSYTHKKMLVLMTGCLLMLFSCSNEFVPEKKENKKQKENTQTSFLNSNYLPAEEVMADEAAKKKALFPDAYKEAWVITEVENSMNYFGFHGKSLDEIETKYRNLINQAIISKIAKKAEDLTKSLAGKYYNISCNLTYEGIQKGDIILTVTRNSVAMAVDSENNVHHGFICIQNPVDDNDPVFMAVDTAEGSTDNKVGTFSMKKVQLKSDFAVVLRLYNQDQALIDRTIEFAKKQTGKGYSFDFTRKETTDKYYCGQFIWRSFFEGGLDIDSNGNLYKDYGLVLLSDIYRCPYFYIIKFSD